MFAQWLCLKKGCWNRSDFLCFSHLYSLIELGVWLQHSDWVKNIKNSRFQYANIILERTWPLICLSFHLSIYLCLTYLSICLSLQFPSPGGLSSKRYPKGSLIGVCQQLTCSSNPRQESAETCLSFLLSFFLFLCLCLSVEQLIALLCFFFSVFIFYSSVTAWKYEIVA